jgi:hypothetical protein
MISSDIQAALLLRNAIRAIAEDGLPNRPHEGNLISNRLRAKSLGFASDEIIESAFV